MSDTEIHEVRKGLWTFFLDCALGMLIGCSGKVRSHRVDTIHTTCPSFLQVHFPKVRSVLDRVPGNEGASSLSTQTLH